MVDVNLTEETINVFLSMLNELAEGYGWHVEIGTNNTFYVKNSQNHTIYADSNPYSVAFYIGGNYVR